MFPIQGEHFDLMNEREEKASPITIIQDSAQFAYLVEEFRSTSPSLKGGVEDDILFELQQQPFPIQRKCYSAEKRYDKTAFWRPIHFY
jgi:hypothetical protein